MPVTIPPPFLNPQVLISRDRGCGCHGMRAVSPGHHVTPSLVTAIVTPDVTIATRAGWTHGSRVDAREQGVVEESVDLYFQNMQRLLEYSDMYHVDEKH